MKPPAASDRIAAVPRYRPGRSEAAAVAEHGLAAAIALASNESPFGPLPGVSEAVAAAVGQVNRYPDDAAAALVERFAEHVGVGRRRVTVGNGSVGLLEQLALAYVDAGDEVLYPWPSFVAYPKFTRLAGGVETTVALRRQTFDADAIVAALSERTKLVLLANPNNPTSTVLRCAELQRIVEAVPADCLVVVDEAYREFVTDPDVPDAIELFADRPNVAVLRTLSKAYSLAGMRVGFLVGDPAVVDAVNTCALPFGVNAPAQAAALVALENSGEVARRCAIVTAERARVAQQLRRRGLGVPSSQANFWWLAAGRHSDDLAAALEGRGVVTRPLGVGVRVTVGAPDENERFLEALDEAIGADPTLQDDWGVATGDHAVNAARWIDRLDDVTERFCDHLDVDHPGRTEPVPGEDETWDDRQVWAHVAEFGDYWLAELSSVLDSPDDVPSFGRTRRDVGRIAAIESGRCAEPSAHLETMRRSAGRLAALLAEMTTADWNRRGRHETLGVMDVDTQLRHFHVGHYEEHADQLDSIRSLTPSVAADG